jgi:hypothetical protein
VRLRHKERFLVQKLQIDVHIISADECPRDFPKGFTRPLIESRMWDRLNWLNQLVPNSCSSINAENVLIRMIIDSARVIHEVERFLKTRWHLYARRISCRAEVVMNDYELGDSQDGFESATLLGAWTPGWQSWKFDEEVVQRCERA